MSDGIVAYLNSEPSGAALTLESYTPFRAETEFERQVTAKRVFQSPAPVSGLSDASQRELERKTTAAALPLIDKITALSKEMGFVVHGHALKPVSAIVFDEAVRLAQVFVRTGLAISGSVEGLALPAVLRTSAGAIQFEWHRKNIDLEIEVATNGHGQAYLEREGGGEPLEIDLVDGFGPIEESLKAVMVR